MGDIERLSYETGLTNPELSAIDLPNRHTHDNLYRLAELKTHGVDFTNLEAALSKSEPASNATRTLRATYAIDYLEWLMRTCDGVLSRYVVSDTDLEMRRRAFQAIRERITKPTEPGRVKRTVFTGHALAKLEDHVETCDPAAIWKDRLRQGTIESLPAFAGAGASLPSNLARRTD